MNRHPEGAGGAGSSAPDEKTVIGTPAANGANGANGAGGGGAVAERTMIASPSVAQGSGVAPAVQQATMIATMGSGSGSGTASGTGTSGIMALAPPSMDSSGLLALGTGRSESSEVTGMFMPGGVARPGLRIAQYEIIRELGAGGMGTVYLARDLRLGRKVAIKVLQTNHPELTQRFIIEARATARCQQENIVIIYEVGEAMGNPYMVLEYLKGTVLTDLVTGGKRLPAARCVEIMVPVVRALVTAHAEGIVHRDLKPDNIFVTESGTIKVLDFGIAKVLAEREPDALNASSPAINMPPASAAAGKEADYRLTQRGTIIGTMKYMSPEQWGIGVEIDNRTDIWATGVILFRMLAGKHPLAPLQGQQLVVTAMLDRPMPKLREVAPDVPQGLCDIVDRCLLKRKEERYENAAELLAALEPFLPGRFHRELKQDETPYAGLASFQERDADRFFGRSREIAAAVNRIRETPTLAIIGPSGVGKSSFVRAGLVPALKQSGEKWETVIVRPGRNPMAALANMLSPMVGTSNTLNEDLSSQQELMNRLIAEPGHLGTVLRARARREHTRILLFVDQFEELYTLVPDHAERLAFTSCLAGVADDPTAPLRVALSLRADFLDRVSEDPALLAEVTQGLFFLPPPNRDGLRDALVAPAEMAGYRFENNVMVEEMLTHLETTPGALPLLQFAASKLWESRDQARRVLTQHSYVAMGGIGGALASHADAVLAELPSQQQLLARGVLLRLVTPERTRAIVSLSELQEVSREMNEVQRLVDQLVHARLLVVQQSADGNAAGSTVELVHESLIQTWPALKRWLDENQDDAAFLDQLRTAAKQWHAKGRDPGTLWRGDAAEEARRWAKRNRGGLSDLQKAYLEAVLSQASRTARRRRLAVATVIAFLSLAVAAAAVALFVIRQSQQEAKKQAIVATEAKKLAVDNEKKTQKALDDLQEKERQRVAAEKEKEKAVDIAADATTKLGLTYEQLADKNAELSVALDAARDAEEKAKDAQEDAEDNFDEANRAKLAAEAAKVEVQKQKERVDELLTAERERVKELEAQAGPAMEVLP
jgi:serine/threonine protein kinase